MREHKRRLLPNSRELAVNFNKRVVPDTITEHNDFSRVEWTEVDPKDPQDYFTGLAALRIPSRSQPRYRVSWPIQHGRLNEGAYSTKAMLYQDIATIIEDAIIRQLGIRKKDWPQCSCVVLVSDLYERIHVTALLDMFMRDFGFDRVAFMQESIAASYGAGTAIACVVDIGAQSTKIACIEDGMIVEHSRVKLVYGGDDVTETFVKMMLHDHFPYADINMNRRHDILLADELKRLCCTMNENDINVQLYDFHLRAAGQDTKKYQIKTYDEGMLAPMVSVNESSRLYDVRLPLLGLLPSRTFRILAQVCRSQEIVRPLNKYLRWRSG